MRFSSPIIGSDKTPLYPEMPLETNIEPIGLKIFRSVPRTPTSERDDPKSPRKVSGGGKRPVVRRTTWSTWESKLVGAAGNGNEEIVKAILGQVSANDELPLWRRTALQAAARGGHEGVVRILLNAGAEPSLPVAGGIKEKFRLQEVVCGILEAGASIDEMPVMPVWGETALQGAAKNGQGGVIKMLLNSGANVNARDIWGGSCLHVLPPTEVIEDLITSNADVNLQDYDGSTPLHHATNRGPNSAVNSLLHAGADMKIKDNRNQRPLDIALEKRSMDTIMLLLNWGDDIRGYRMNNWRTAFEADKREVFIKIQQHANHSKSIEIISPQDMVISMEAQTPGRIRTQTPNSQSIKRIYSTFGVKSDSLKRPLIEPWDYMQKYLDPERLLSIRSPEGQAVVQWVWALVDPDSISDLGPKSKNFGTGIPNIGNMVTTVDKKAFLICYVCFEFLVRNTPIEGGPGTATAVSGTFQTRAEKSQISWIMRTDATPDVDSETGIATGQKSSPMFRSMNFRSTLDCGWVPDHGVEFFTLFILDLHKKWEEIFDHARAHLAKNRERLLLNEGRSSGLVKDLLRDAQKWGDFRALLQIHVGKARDLEQDFREKNLLNEEIREWERTRDDYENTKETAIPNLSQAIHRFEMETEQEIAKLDKKTKEMIELEFSLVSINEARMSTRMAIDAAETAISMKRLSWITFIFLPLVFVASLFGMNVDILKDNPEWWWYITFAGVVVVVVVVTWILFKYIEIETWVEYNIGTYIDNLFDATLVKMGCGCRRRRNKKNSIDLERGDLINLEPI